MAGHTRRGERGAGRSSRAGSSWPLIAAASAVASGSDTVTSTPLARAPTPAPKPELHTRATYRNLRSVGGSVYYIRQGSKDAAPALQVYDLAAQKETALGSVTAFQVSANGKKMLVGQGDGRGRGYLPRQQF